MCRTLSALLIVTVVTTTACTDATVVTGGLDTARIVPAHWATSFVYDVVPPSVAPAAARCPAGVVTVTRQHTPVNTLVTIITLGMFSPVTISVTCATPGATPSIEVPATATAEARRNALADAADAAVKTHRPVVVRYNAACSATSGCGDASSASSASLASGSEK